MMRQQKSKQFSLTATSKNYFLMGRAKDFFSNFVLKTAGILCVFQGFHKQKLGKKICPERKKELLELPR